MTRFVTLWQDLWHFAYAQHFTVFNEFFRQFFAIWHFFVVAAVHNVSFGDFFVRFCSEFFTQEFVINGFYKTVRIFYDKISIVRINTKQDRNSRKLTLRSV